MELKELNISIGKQSRLTDYFSFVYKNAESNWNVESSLPLFGQGKSNEGTEESNAIKRYYIEPIDKRFNQIFLNFDESRNVESIVWFMDVNNSELISLGELKEVFGEFKTQNIIYDETTEVVFTPNLNKNVQYLRTSILEWVEKRKNGSIYFKKDKNEIEVDDDYKVSKLTMKIVPNTPYKPLRGI